ncbi:MAG: hypothetical protein O2963_00195 [Proteobacteria bacterium]|nr:hypothetical protein [Pseudomonadota bacterium]
MGTPLTGLGIPPLPSSPSPPLPTDGLPQDDSVLMPNAEPFPNLAKGMSKDKLADLADLVIQGFDNDYSTGDKFRAMHASWLKQFSMQREPKNEPWENCSNIGLPMLTTSAIQFHAGAYPSLVPPKGVVKAHPVKKGADARDVADRKARYMEYYLTRKKTNFLESMDTTCMKEPIEGTVIRKRYYDPIRKMVLTDWLSPIDFVINNNVRYLTNAERYTHVIYETENTIKKKMQAGVYVKIDDLGPGNPDNNSTEEYSVQSDKNTGHSESMHRDDSTVPRKLYEQHVHLDLSDGKKNSGVKEPYVVTVDLEDRRVLSIYSRKDPNTDEELIFFTKYGFIKNPNGFYDYGFGLLLDKPNKAINSLINQLIDAGVLQNNQGGFVNKSSGIKRKMADWAMGKFVEIDLRSDDIRKEVMPFKFGSPSQVLFALMGSMQQYVDKLTTVTELKTGALPKSDTSATAVTALIQEGQRVFSAIHARNHRALTEELEGLHDLIALHLDVEDYFQVVIDPEIDMVDPETKEPNISKNEILEMLKADWEEPYRGIALVSDPNISSTQERVAKAQFVYETASSSPVTGQNLEAIFQAQKSLYKAMDIDDDVIQAVLIPPPQEAPPDLPQEEENQIFMKDGMVDALETQDHARHLEVMEEFELSQFFEVLTPIGAKNFDLHKRQHFAFVYGQTVKGLDSEEQQQQAPQQQQQEGGEVIVN